MLALLIPALAFAALQDAPRPAEPAVTLPMSRQTWDGMTPEGRSRYARITVQALRTSPDFARCDMLDADMLEIRIGEVAETGAPLMMAVAVAATSLCDEAKP